MMFLFKYLLLLFYITSHIDLIYLVEMKQNIPVFIYHKRYKRLHLCLFIVTKYHVILVQAHSLTKINVFLLFYSLAWGK